MKITVQYFYLPIESHGGTLFKCAGVCVESNKGWFLREHPDAVIVDGYRGNVARASDMSDENVNRNT